MSGNSLLDYIELGVDGRIRECVKRHSDTYAIFSCPRKYEKIVIEELNRLHIGISQIPTKDRKKAEYVILKHRKEQVEKIVEEIIEKNRRKSRFR